MEDRSAPIGLLVADGDPEFCELVIAALWREPGVRVVGAAEDADQAVELSGLHKPDVALVASGMLENAGARMTEVAPQTKVLARLEVEDRDSVLAAFLAGAVGYVTRGCSPADLVRSVTYAAAGQAVMSRADTALVIDSLVGLVHDSKRARRELPDLDGARSELFHVLSEELLVPATVIVGIAQALTRRGVPTERVRELASTVRGPAARLRRVVRNLSLASALETDMLRVVPRAVTAGELISHLAAHLPEEGRVRLLSDAGQLEARLDVDLGLTVRALSALIDNALQRSPCNSPVDVTVRRVDAEIEIRVSDRGPRIAEAFRAGIFELIVQRDAEDTQPPPGTRVGLFLALRVMQAHLGRIEVRENPGGGSTFALVFPASSMAAAAPGLYSSTGT